MWARKPGTGLVIERTKMALAPSLSSVLNSVEENAKPCVEQMLQQDGSFKREGGRQ